MVTAKAEQQLLTSLEKRVEFWSRRFAKCKQAGRPEMVAACTALLDELENPESQKRFAAANEKFKQAVLPEVIPFITRYNVKTAMELFVGAGIFFRELIEYIPELWGIELVGEAVEYLRSRLIEDHHLLPSSAKRVVCGNAHMIEDLWITRRADQMSLDAVLAFRGFLHQPEKEWRQTVAGARRVLAEEGLFIVGELFQDELVELLPDRELHKGTWYRSRDEYQQVLGPRMELIHLSGICDNDGDPCRVAIWRRMPRRK